MCTFEELLVHIIGELYLSILYLYILLTIYIYCTDISSHHLTPFLSTNWTSCTKTKTNTCTKWAFEYLLVIIMDILLGIGIWCLLLLLFYVVVYVLNILLFVGIGMLFLFILHHYNLLPLLNNLQYKSQITPISKIP